MFITTHHLLLSSIISTASKATAAMRKKVFLPMRSQNNHFSDAHDDFFGNYLAIKQKNIHFVNVQISHCNYENKKLPSNNFNMVLITK